MSELEFLLKAHTIFQSVDVTPKALLLLAVACDAPFMTGKEIYEKYPCVFSRNSFPRLAGELEAKGWLTTGPRPGADKGTTYSPTALGLKALKDSFKAAEGIPD